MGNITAIFGTHDDKTQEQLRDVASRAELTALMADGHKGYVMPIGGAGRGMSRTEAAGKRNRKTGQLIHPG